MRIMRKFLWISMILIGSGAILFGIGLLLGGRDYLATADLNRFGLKQGKHPDIQKMDKKMLDSFDSIVLTAELAKVNIEPSNDNHAYLSYHITNKNSTSNIKYAVADNTLTINQLLYDEKYHLGIDLSFINYLFAPEQTTGQQTAITLYLPKNQLRQIDADVEIGDLAINQLQAENADISVELGDLTFNQSMIDTLTTHVEQGRQTAHNSTFHQAELSIEQGELALENSELSNSELTTEIGALHLQQSTFTNSYFSTETGEITSKDTTFIGKNQLTSELGNIELTLAPKAFEDTSFSLASELGKIAIPDLAGTKTNHSFESTDALTNQLRITVETGKITVK
uniref:DUF4097 family beta strand repeat-containing protein n=1 Tax=Candidatus Enterococcus willemsii TaxID=1857215 RepID=UPI00403FB6BD